MIKKILFVVFCLLLLADLGYVNYRLLADNADTAKSTENAEVKSAEGCDLGCQRVIEEKVATGVARLADEWEKKLAVTQQTTESNSANANKQQTKTVNEPKIVIIPIASSGETSQVSWTEVKPSEFYFDLINYPGAKEVRFEAYILAEHGGSKIYARLYDATNNRGVDYSDIQTNSGSYIRIQSSKVSIWRGNNKYIVQLKSENGTVAKIKDAKLVISYR